MANDNPRARADKITSAICLAQVTLQCVAIAEAVSARLEAIRDGAEPRDDLNAVPPATEPPTEVETLVKLAPAISKILDLCKKEHDRLMKE